LLKHIIILACYIFIAVPYLKYQTSGKQRYSIVSKSGHLSWETVDIEKNKYLQIVNWCIWLFFTLFSFVYNGYILGLLFTVILLGIVVYNYYQDNAIGSMWCWFLNSLSIYYAVYLLIYLPFCEKKTICYKKDKLK